MRQVRRWLFTLLPALAATALLAGGCGGDKKDGGGKTGGGGASTGDTKGASGAAKELEVEGYTTLSGRVTYNGDGEPTIKMLKPEKDTESCPKEVPAEGWYTNNSSDKKGVQYTLVFLKPPKGTKMSKWAPELEKPDPEIVDMHQPRCQFEPRMIALHPKQKVKFHNDSQPAIKHDANLGNTRNQNPPKLLNPGETVEYNVIAYDQEPARASCGIHTGTMGGYVWKMTHPYAVVTDADGKFELKHVPVPKGGDKMILAVWHEMLPNKFKDIGPVDLKVGEPATKDVAIPK